MRPLPRPTDYGAWDELPVDPRTSDLDLSQQHVQEGIKRREVLKDQWATYWHYPHGTWRTEVIAAHAEQAEAIAYLNGRLARWSR